MTAVIILLLLPLALGSKNGLQVTQPLWQEVSPNGTANITCDCKIGDTATSDIDLQIRLIKTSDSNWSCSANRKTSPHCSVWQDDRGGTTFILSHLKPDRYVHVVYICECTRARPTPVLRDSGNGTVLVAVEIHCPILNFWTWTLIGVAGFFCLCGLCSIFRACAYIKLRVLQSEETDDSVTYVQMQRKKRDPDNNAEYVDMREVYSAGRGSGRDMNYNSQQFHAMFNPRQ